MHSHPHAFTNFQPLAHEGLTVASRRNFLKAGLAGIAGLRGCEKIMHSQVERG